MGISKLTEELLKHYCSGGKAEWKSRLAISTLSWYLIFSKVGTWFDNRTTSIHSINILITYYYLHLKLVKHNAFSQNIKIITKTMSIFYFYEKYFFSKLSHCCTSGNVWYFQGSYTYKLVDACFLHLWCRKPKPVSKGEPRECSKVSHQWLFFLTKREKIEGRDRKPGYPPNY